jgi:hypothetical protein
LFCRPEDVAPGIIHEVPLIISVEIEAGPGPPLEAPPASKNGRADKEKAVAATAAAAAAAAAEDGAPLNPLLGTHFRCACGSGPDGSPLEIPVTHAFSEANAPSSTTVMLRLTEQMVRRYVSSGSNGIVLTLEKPGSGEPLGTFEIGLLPLVRAEPAATGR